MNRYAVSIISAALCCWLGAATLSGAAEPDLNELFTSPETEGARIPAAVSLCSAYNELNSLIRDGRIGRIAARTELFRMLTGIRAEYYRNGGRDYPATQWVFPVAGYAAGAIDKGGGHGFVPGGYDFFSGNRHGGHPAYDIFIRDRNQDRRDDRSGKPVSVLSMTGGIVVALEKGWQQGSGLRGGNYLWVYDPANDLLVYYAHNEELFVTLGTIVRPGELLASVGRSGLNAAKRRSPTHLHFSVLHLVDGKPVPVNVYRDLQRVCRVRSEGLLSGDFL